MTTLAPPVQQTRCALQAAEIDCPSAFISAGRLAAYTELAKPRIALMVLLSMAVGYVVGSQGVWRPQPLLHACVGIFLAVVTSSALNQYLERKTDGRMPRTWNRPLPTSRLNPLEVLLFAVVCGLSSIMYLAWTTNTLTACLTASTIVLYAACYTPLKSRTAFCTVVGAIPGALPPVLGWTAAGGSLGSEAFSLFAILFLWQFPHFLAIAWMYREQYAQAGLKMLPAGGRPRIVGLIAVGYALALIPVSLLPLRWGLCGDGYGILAVLLGLIYAATAIWFERDETRARARGLLWVSLVYLPTLFVGLTLDHLRLLS